MSYPPESFERHIVPALFEPWAQALIEFAHPRQGDRVLDVACGSGIVARRIAPLVGGGGAVVGIDLASGMIREARAAANREGLSIRFEEAPAERLPFDAGRFDLVTCQFGLMFFQDRLAAAREMLRVLVPGGRAVISVWQGIDKHPFYQALHAASVRRIGTSGVESVYSLADPEHLRGVLAAAGLVNIQIVPASVTARFSAPEQFLAWELEVDQQSIPSMRGLGREEWQVVLHEIRTDLEPAVQAATQDGALVLDFHAHLARAEKSW